jgi:uncharacterized protein YbcV (DUF1398 family)
MNCQHLIAWNNFDEPMKHNQTNSIVLTVAFIIIVTGINQIQKNEEDSEQKRIQTALTGMNSIQISFEKSGINFVRQDLYIKMIIQPKVQ